jgi:hypothetical protein
MLRKSNSARAGSAADDTIDPGASKRSWAVMRARLRQGREPIFGAAAVEPPPATTSQASRDGGRPAAAEHSGRPAEPTPPAEARSRTRRIRSLRSPSPRLRTARTAPAVDLVCAGRCLSVAPQGGTSRRRRALSPARRVRSILSQPHQPGPPSTFVMIHQLSPRAKLLLPLRQLNAP